MPVLSPLRVATCFSTLVALHRPMIIPLEIPVIIRTFHRHAVEAHRRIIPSIVALNQIAFAGLHRWKFPPTRPGPSQTVMRHRAFSSSVAPRIV